MDYANNPAESIPLQRGRHCALPEQPEEQPVVPYTTVNTELPKDHIIWSLCSFLYFNFMFLGLAALIFSIKARDRNLVRDLQGAQRHGSIALKLNIAATVLSSTTFLIVICIKLLIDFI